MTISFAMQKISKAVYVTACREVQEQTIDIVIRITTHVGLGHLATCL